MKIAIFGGSFDPPHTGHEQIIEKSLAKLDIDALFVVPTYLNPFKKKFFAPPDLRYRWVKKLLLPYPRAKALDYELRQNRPVATIETVRYLRKRYHPQKIYLIIGADNLPDLPRWKAYRKLKKMVTFVVATRKGVAIPQNLQKLEVNANISSTELRKKIKREMLP
ncbi:MAG TPA: nicotinate (nicotinamide) nucleotide adenylyltransferase, partial [Campylobacteraceae bacterium]|nr:nicotinate (nicotinamide) nucleotide adenylyltransferase [Campylobacteraceae bacterium]